MSTSIAATSTFHPHLERPFGTDGAEQQWMPAREVFGSGGEQLDNLRVEQPTG